MRHITIFSLFNANHSLFLSGCCCSYPSLHVYSVRGVQSNLLLWGKDLNFKCLKQNFYWNIWSCEKNGLITHFRTPQYCKILWLVLDANRARWAVHRQTVSQCWQGAVLSWWQNIQCLLLNSCLKVRAKLSLLQDVETCKIVSSGGTHIF